MDPELTGVDSPPWFYCPKCERENAFMQNDEGYWVCPRCNWSMPLTTIPTAIDEQTHQRLLGQGLRDYEDIWRNLADR